MKLKAIYDNKGETIDRYTIVTTESRLSNGMKLYTCIGSCTTGIAFFTWSECQIGKHLGKKVQLESLDKGLQNKTIEALKS